MKILLASLILVASCSSEQYSSRHDSFIYQDLVAVNRFVEFQNNQIYRGLENAASFDQAAIPAFNRMQDVTVKTEELINVIDSTQKILLENIKGIFTETDEKSRINFLMKADEILFQEKILLELKERIKAYSDYLTSDLVQVYDSSIRQSIQGTLLLHDYNDGVILWEDAHYKQIRPMEMLIKFELLKSKIYIAQSEKFKMIRQEAPCICN